MTIHNLDTVNRAKLWLIRLPLMITLMVLVAQLLDWIHVTEILIALGAITILCILATLILRMHYIEVSQSDGKLFIRFYHLFPLIREYRMVEIPDGQLLKMEMKPAVMGLTEVLILTVNTTRGVAVFPELPLTLVSQDKRQEMFRLIQSCL